MPCIDNFLDFSECLIANFIFTCFIYCMSIKGNIEKRLIKFGKNNSPTLVAMSIATAKGIFRPMFTMMDKDESYETKKYTALREGLTELIAIPVYYLSGVVSSKLSKKLAIPKHLMSKEMYSRYKAGDMANEVNQAFAHAKNLSEINLPKITTTTAFIGVCISALFLIPLICSATIKPIMKQIDKKEHNRTENINPVQNPVKTTGNLQTFKGFCNNYGMKVGGL